jgi:hypothetical protein
VLDFLEQHHVRADERTTQVGSDRSEFGDAGAVGAFERVLNVEDIIPNWKVNLPVRAQNCLEHNFSTLERHEFGGNQIALCQVRSLG